MCEVPSRVWVLPKGCRLMFSILHRAWGKRAGKGRKGGSLTCLQTGPGMQCSGARDQGEVCLWAAPPVSQSLRPRLERMGSRGARSRAP